MERRFFFASERDVGNHAGDVRFSHQKIPSVNDEVSVPKFLERSFAARAMRLEKILGDEFTPRVVLEEQPFTKPEYFDEEQARAYIQGLRGSQDLVRYARLDYQLLHPRNGWAALETSMTTPHIISFFARGLSTRACNELRNCFEKREKGYELHQVT